MLYYCAKSHKIKMYLSNTHSARNATQSWNNILSSGNDKSLWAAINWNGTIGDIFANNDNPSDVEFCRHFKELLNRPVESDLSDYQPTTQCYIPVIDDPITPYEETPPSKDWKVIRPLVSTVYLQVLFSYCQMNGLYYLPSYLTRFSHPHTRRAGHNSKYSQSSRRAWKPTERTTEVLAFCYPYRKYMTWFLATGLECATYLG